MMRKLVVAVALVLAMGALLVGCTPSPTVYDLTQDPEGWHGKLITIEGTVGFVTPALSGVRAYVLEDETGQIWVMSRASAPSEGTVVKVDGRVNKSVEEIPELASVAAEMIGLPAITGVNVVELDRKVAN